MKSFNDYIHNIREEPPSQIIKGQCEIQKADNEKRQIFGWASVAIDEGGEQPQRGDDDYFACGGLDCLVHGVNLTVTGLCCC